MTSLQEVFYGNPSCLFHVRVRGRMIFFEDKPDSILLRLPIVLLPEGLLPQDIEYVPLRTTLYRDRRFVDFLRFLLGAIVRDPDGKVSPKVIWNEWAGRPGKTEIDLDEEIAGIRFGDVQTLFIDAFDPPGERVRGRLDGDCQRVWRGFRLASRKEESLQQLAAPETPAAPAGWADSVTQDKARVDAKDGEIILEVPYDGPTRAKFRYRLDESPIGVTMYLDRDSEAGAQRPIAYKVSFEPIYE